MIAKTEKEIIGNEQCFLLCRKALNYYDRRLMEHGERVAYIACEIQKRLPYRLETKYVLLLSLFHDIGAYKTEDIDHMVEFESSEVWNHSVYGYLFLKYFTPLEKMSQVILHHHTSNERYKTMDFAYKEYSNLIQLADRLEIAIRRGRKKEELMQLVRTKRYCRIQADAAEWVLEHTGIYEKVRNGNTAKEFQQYFTPLMLERQENIGFLKMLVYSIDFKSKHTVHHSVDVTVVSKYLAEKSGFSKADLDKLVYAAFLHDIGKIATPVEILEHPGRLNDIQMEIMRKHVEYSQEILSGTLDEDIVHMACRHHEKLDGSGYPHHLRGEELGLGDRIIAVADITSALIGVRSYKKEFGKEKTLRILKNMAEAGYIDEGLVNIVVKEYDGILAEVEKQAATVEGTYQEFQREYNQLTA